MTTQAIAAGNLVSEILAESRSPKEVFIPSRFPYTYAADFVRVHPQRFRPWTRPDDLGRALLSRADAAGVYGMYATGTGQDRDAVAYELAYGYLKDNDVAGWSFASLEERMADVRRPRT